MKMLSLLKLSLSLFVFLGIETATAADPQLPPTRIRLSKHLQAPDCQAMLAYAQPVLEQTLLNLGARRGSAYLGFYNEMEEILVSAGVRPRIARYMASAVDELHAWTFTSPFLSYPAGVYDLLIKNKNILPCVLSPNCTLAKAENNFVMFTKRDAEAIIILPFPQADPQRFAINFLGSFSSLAGEYFVSQWMYSNYSLAQRDPNRVDPFYKQYANGLDGNRQLEENSLGLRFTITFLSLYQTYITAMLYESFFPEDSQRNRRHLAEHSIRDLTLGHNAKETAGIVESLGLNTQNYYDKIEELLTEMQLTMASVQ